MALIVQKYGGSSVVNSQKIMNVAQRVIETKNKGNDVIVVLSAMGDTTDELINLAQGITKLPPRREMDALISTGEQISISLLAMAIMEKGVSAVSLTGQQVGIITDSMHTKAKIVSVNKERMQKEIEKSKVIVVAGFQGVDDNNDITTLGRGGSDTTAVAVAAALGADICEIYTDVDGVYTADPRTVLNAEKLQEISYDEMLELASVGAGVLNPRSVECAKLHGVELHVLSSFNKNTGTLVREGNKLEKKVIVRGVAKDDHIARIAIKGVPDKPGIAYRVCDVLSKDGINIDMIIQSINTERFNDMLFTINRDDLDRAVKILGTLVGEIGAKDFAADSNVAKISIVGAGIASTPGVATKMFQAFFEKGINIQAISTSELKISCIISRDRIDDAMRAVHDKFILSKVDDYIIPES